MSRTFRVRTIVIATCVSCLALGAGIALAAPGDLDTSFDGDGVAELDFTGNSSVTAVAMQGDRVLAAGNADTSGADLAAIARFNSNGTLDDPAFAGDGAFNAQYDGDPTTLNGMAVRPGGQIVTTGSKTPSATDLGVVAQHTPTGELDTAGFGGGDGLVNATFDFSIDGSASRLEDVVLAANGDAVAVGTAERAAQGENFALFRVNSAGTTVLNEGQVNVAGAIGNAAGDDNARAVAIDPADGDIIAVGNVDPAGADGNDVAVVRYTSAGAVDMTFGGGDGIATKDIGEGDVAMDVAVRPDGKIVVAGHRDSDAAGFDSDHFIYQLTGSGAPDLGFGGSGDGLFVQSIVGPDNTGDALALLPDGRVVVGGATLGGLSDWVVARYTAAGVPDTGFDVDGSRTYSFAGEAAALNALALQPDGKLLAGGDLLDMVDRDFAVGRLQADDPPVVTPPIATPIAAPPAPSSTPAKRKCKKGRKLRNGKCVKKKRRR